MQNESSRLTDEVSCDCTRQQLVAIPVLTPHPTCAMLLAAFSRRNFRAGHLPLQGKAFRRSTIQCLIQFSNRNEENETNTVISTEGEPEANRSGEI